MIAVFYNPNKDIYYSKLLKSAFWYSEYEVGYINQYGHIIVCMFYISDNGKLINCKSIHDYFDNCDISLKERLVRKLIEFLERSVKNE